MNVITVQRTREILVAPCGDWHVGSAHTDYAALNKAVDEIIARDMDVILMGDLLDTPTRTSLTSPWEEVMSPSRAYKYARELLQKLQAKRRRCICGVLGNHPYRVEKESGMNPEEMLYTSADIPCLRFSGAVHYVVGRHNGGYLLYVHHTARGGRRAGSGVNSVEDLTDVVEGADIYLGGHTHRLGATPVQRYHLYISKRPDQLRARTVYLVNCGSFLQYDDSYAEQKEMAPLPIGFPIISLRDHREEHDIEVEIRTYAHSTD